MPIMLTWKGDRKLQRMFQKLPRKMQRKHTRAALRKGANVILRDARSLAPRESGHLARSIKVKGRRTRFRWIERMVVTTSKKNLKTDAGGKYFYGAAQEFGARTVRGAVHFMERAAERNFQKAVNRVRRVWAVKVITEARSS
jgi:HK97 gp10 family phage protein